MEVLPGQNFPKLNPECFAMWHGIQLISSTFLEVLTQRMPECVSVEIPFFLTEHFEYKTLNISFENFYLSSHLHAFCQLFEPSLVLNPYKVP